MLKDEKNLKDPEGKSLTSYGASSSGMSFILSYTKTDKLITALYMVTDVMDKEEPLRKKLRTLGIEILSDINSVPANARGKVSEAMSFLDIASTMGIISEMNCSILKREFSELDRSIKESIGGTKMAGSLIDLEQYLKNSPLEGWLKAGVDKSIPPPPGGYSSRGESKGQINSKGHTRLGVQKGSTLMKALSETKLDQPATSSFNELKKQRRNDITNFIQKSGGGVTITDIKSKAEGSIPSCGEKTLQRELVSMVKDGVLNKTGEKRWSRYFLKITP